MESTLERRYGRLLLTYPARYRQARGAEMLDTLLRSSRPGQRWPSPADAVDLIAGGLRNRAGLSAVPGLARGLALAGPIALTFAGGLCAYLIIVEFTAVAQGWGHDRHRGLGPLPTLGPIVYGTWVLAAAGRVALPRLASRWIIAAALLVTVLIVPAAHTAELTRPSLPLLVPLLLLGLVALAGTAHDAPRRERVGVALGLPVTVGALIGLTYWHLRGVVVGTALVTHELVPETVPGPLALAYGGSAVVVAGMAMLVLLVGLTVAGAWHRPALWSAAVLLVPGLPLVALLGPEIASMQYSAWAVMPAGLAAAVVVLALAIRLAWRDPVSGLAPAARGTTESALSSAGSFALGTAAAASVLVWLTHRYELAAGYASCDWPGCAPGREFAVAVTWALAAIVAVLPIRWAARVAVAGAIAVTMVPPPGADFRTYFGGPFGRPQLALLAVGVVALVGLPADPARRAVARLGGLGAAAALCAVVTLAPAWWEIGTVANPFAVVLGAATALVIGLIAGGRAMLEPMSPLWARGAVIALASSAWLGVAGPPYLGAWQAPLTLAGLVALVAAGAVWAVVRARAAAA